MAIQGWFEKVTDSIKGEFFKERGKMYKPILNLMERKHSKIWLKN
jgi:hypothetical protein